MQVQYTERLKKIEEELRKIIPPSLDGSWKPMAAGPYKSEPEDASISYLHAPVLDLLNRGGKRWRPLLFLLAGEMAGSGETALHLCPLVELAHNGTLIMDDIEDGAETRRGEEAVHLRYGIDISINSGNYLYFLPTLLIDRASLSEKTKWLLYSYYSRYMRLLHIGQGMDIRWHNSPDFFPPRDQYFQMCRYKTGGLSGFSGTGGFIAGGGEKNEAEALGRICEDMGVAFQIFDDVKNLTTGNPGKMRGEDVMEGKKSLPMVLYAEKYSGAPKRIIRIFQTLKTPHRSDFKGKNDQKELIEEAISLLRESGAIEEAETRAKHLLIQTREDLINHFAPSEARDCIEFMMQRFVS